MKIFHNYPLEKVSFLPLKGRVDKFIVAESIFDLFQIIDRFDKYNCPYYLIGEGTNTLFIKSYIKTPIIAYKNKDLFFENNKIFISGFKKVNEAISEIQKKGYSNLSSLLGLPGSIGAGIKNNSSFGEYNLFEDLLGIITYHKEIISFIPAQKISRSYRKTDIKGIVIYAIYAPKMDKSEIKQGKINLMYRKEHQDLKCHSLGSTFLNPPSQKAYKLIQGVKEKLVDEKCKFSDIHANFLDVKKDSKPEAIYSLIIKTQAEVKSKYGIDLVSEIKMVD